MKSEVKEEEENEMEEEGEKTMNDRNGENEETRDDTVSEMIMRKIKLDLIADESIK